MPSGNSATPSSAPPPHFSSAPGHREGPAVQMTVTLLELGSPCAPACGGILGLSLPLTLSSLLVRWGDGAGHPSVLVRNAHKEKQKLAATVVGKGSGAHPLFIFSSVLFPWQFQILHKCCCQLSRTSQAQVAP